MNVDAEAAAQNLPHFHLSLQKELQGEQEPLGQTTDSEYESMP